VSSAAASGLLDSKINTAPNKMPVARARVKKRPMGFISSCPTDWQVKQPLPDFEIESAAFLRI
jgi:hypothetical protein